MSEHIETEAKAYIYRTGRLFSRKRYTVALYIGEIETPIHVHARNYAGARDCAMYLAEHAEDILREHGLMSHAYEQVKHARLGDPSLPKVGEVVYTTEDIGFYTAGTECVVLDSGWDEAEVGEFQFPLTVSPVDEPSEVRIPLRLSEFTREHP